MGHHPQDIYLVSPQWYGAEAAWLSWMSVLSESPCLLPTCQLPSLCLLPTLGGATDKQRPWGWADHGLVPSPEQRKAWKKGGPA